MAASILRLSPPSSNALFRGSKFIVVPLKRRNMTTSASAIQKLLTVGTKIIGVGRNYAAHAKELGNAVPKVPFSDLAALCYYFYLFFSNCVWSEFDASLKEPVLFLKPTTSYLENGGKIEVPEPLEALDHEVELAVVIGQRARDVPEASAMDYVGGIVVRLSLLFLMIISLNGGILNAFYPTFWTYWSAYYEFYMVWMLFDFQFLMYTSVHSCIIKLQNPIIWLHMHICENDRLV